MTDTTAINRQTNLERQAKVDMDHVKRDKPLESSQDRSNTNPEVEVNLADVAGLAKYLQSLLEKKIYKKDDPKFLEIMEWFGRLMDAVRVLDKFAEIPRSDLDESKLYISTYPEILQNGNWSVLVERAKKAVYEEDMATAGKYLHHSREIVSCIINGKESAFSDLGYEELRKIVDETLAKMGKRAKKETFITLIIGVDPATADADFGEFLSAHFDRQSYDYGDQDNCVIMQMDDK